MGPQLKVKVLDMGVLPILGDKLYSEVAYNGSCF